MMDRRTSASSANFLWIFLHHAFERSSDYIYLLTKRQYEQLQGGSVESLRRRLTQIHQSQGLY